MNKVLQELKKLKNIYQETGEFQIGEKLKLKMKVLTSEEETYVNSYASKYDEGLGFVFAIKRGTLSRSILAVNDEELPEFIEDTDEDGNAEILERHEWLMKYVIVGWSQLLVDAAWNKYAKLMIRVDDSLKDNTEEESTTENKEEPLKQVEE